MFKALNHLIGKSFEESREEIDNFGLPWHIYESQGYATAGSCKVIGISVTNGIIVKVSCCHTYHRDV